MSAFDEWLAAEAAAREEAGLTRRLVDSDRGEPLLDLAGNDYLGLARDPRVIAGALRATQEYGAGAGASRLVSGTLSIHSALEQRLAVGQRDLVDPLGSGAATRGVHGL